MATTTTTLLQHPSHDQHPLEPRDFRLDSIHPRCELCNWEISADGYVCLECLFFVHKACAEAPPRIDAHPLHTQHPLTLSHQRPQFNCDACGNDFPTYFSSFRCDDCDFELDVRCALSTLSDWGGTHRKNPEQIKLQFYPHPLTSLFASNDFVGNINCVICKKSEKGELYMCSDLGCQFLIHKRCVPDLYYTDGTKAPQVFHGHPLATFTGSSRCTNCRSDKSTEFIGCAECRVFYCMDCVQVPESIQYPHHPDHTLVLLISTLDKNKARCDSCSYYLEGKLCYGCPSCEFFVDVGCANQVLSYCDEGMSTEIELSWHEHPWLLRHRNKYDWDGDESKFKYNWCSYCEDMSAGPMYTCNELGCKIQLHIRCTEIKSTIIHSHHPAHPLILCNKVDLVRCGACDERILFLKFFCELCAFYLHPKCAARFPTLKHSLHEHELLHLDKSALRYCNRCGTTTNSPFFRCVPCNFNLHEECMELPRQVVNSKVHWHRLTLHETYIEDDSGEYYCDHCEKSRDIRLGAYVCLQCSARWAYHIECVFPELRTIYEKKSQISIIRRFRKRIARKNEEVRAAEVKLEGMKRELDQLIKEHDELISGEEHYETSTDESEQEESD